MATGQAGEGRSATSRTTARRPAGPGSTAASTPRRPRSPTATTTPPTASGDDWVALGWGFAWPANRRIMYNRASADPQGNPWPKEARLARAVRQRREGLRLLGSRRRRPRPGQPAKVVRGRWVGLDVPDFPVTKPPDRRGQARRPGPRLPRRRLALHHEGRRQGLAVRPLAAWWTARCPPTTSRTNRRCTNLVYPRGRATRRPRSIHVPGNPYAPVGSAEYPVRPLDLPPDRAPPERLDEPLAALAGRAPARAVRRDQPRARRRDRRRRTSRSCGSSPRAPRSAPRPWSPAASGPS